MYKINHNKALNLLEVENSENKVYGKIHLNSGASLQELTLKGHAIIKDLSPLTYANTYASSILFPFANRIKDGVYTFNNKAFQFEINQKEENNALHGLVYNKTFQIINQETSNDSASILLEYNETELSIGFPYTYTIQLKYIFTSNNLSLNVSVKNTDSKAFPYTLGWHPYFLSDNLFNSSLDFNSTKKIVLGERNITTGVEDFELKDAFNIEDKPLDDCWILNSNEVTFNTPKYQLIMRSSAKNNFLQAYTPSKLNTIAIEPTTGVSDSFNNNIGLEVLDANDTYHINWSLKIK
ncbi:aldose 1-epimerase [Flavivirga spongiicola]|uniref:Aldose 1-epimerase n=1 Tax=Flavivirga spongiicola TaxID=421621 RepID=A0ABU7XM60_9FLAO|nr:aldose 1-epimerase [Flavivirga sp. MEBiC05379]MDO5981518.1 aldose 1-epimerase [Flavivirga sp. MEBiC05379]MDO5981920.1 aldose 1-epimerase [Flavivirga sp. MEBiC05379]